MDLIFIVLETHMVPFVGPYKTTTGGKPSINIYILEKANFYNHSSSEQLTNFFIKKKFL